MDTDETAMAVVEAAPITLFRTDEPAAIVARATEVANALAPVLEARKLYTEMTNKKTGEVRRHVLVEGWTLCGTMLGVFPVTTWTRPTLDVDGKRIGWEANVEARTRQGDVVGGADAMCSRDEYRWAKADEYAIRSMSQTRATSRALRQALGFIVTLAGFESTPAEEIPDAVTVPEVADEAVILAIMDYIADLGTDPAADTAKVLAAYSVERLADLTPKQADHLLKGLAKRHADARTPTTVEEVPA